MRITWLLEVADQLWGGVKVALEDANWLAKRGHDVTVVSRSGPPNWLTLGCRFVRVPDFRPEHLPAGDVVIGTFWTTVPWAAAAGADKGAPVHFCQGYEGDNPENEALRDRIEAVYRLPGVAHVTISPHLTRLLRTRFAASPHEVRYTIDHDVHFPGPSRAPGKPLRVGLVGPYGIGWKDLETGYAACRLAHEAGQKLVLVRATNTTIHEQERKQPFPIEWHERLAPGRMGDFYRSLDVFLGTSSGDEEGFFLPAIEAMACGVPSVLTDIPCFRNHAQVAGTEHYALFVPPRDPAAMAEALVIAGSLPDVRVGLRNGGIQVAGAYRREQHGEQLESALKTIAAEHARRRAGAGQRAPLRLMSNSTTENTPPLTTIGASLVAAAERLQNQGDDVGAARAFAAAVCLAPADRNLRTKSGQAWLRAGDAAAALAQFDHLLADGDDEASHVGRGHALHALGRLQEAAQAFRAALAVGARCADSYNRLGVVLFQAGDLAGARDSFERALVLEPGHGDAQANLSSLPAA
jgi:glycosyltransferase involved in cell wall biosynthesis/Flp pilus assembly protein TadD